MYLIACCSSPVTLTFPDSHSEKISFHLYNAPQHPLVLGYPWLTLNNPQTDWSSGKVLSWGKDCKSRCLAGPPNSSSEVVSTSPEDEDHEEFPDLSSVPDCYLGLKQVFNKTKATSLTPHGPYDCAIDLLRGNPPPVVVCTPYLPPNIEPCSSTSTQLFACHSWFLLCGETGQVPFDPASTTVDLITTQ